VYEPAILAPVSGELVTWLTSKVPTDRYQLQPAIVDGVLDPHQVIVMVHEDWHLTYDRAPPADWSQWRMTPRDQATTAKSVVHLPIGRSPLIRGDGHAAGV